MGKKVVYKYNPLNKFDFSLIDVRSTVYGEIQPPPKLSLQDLFSRANDFDGVFSETYKGNKDRLSNFQDYKREASSSGNDLTMILDATGSIGSEGFAHIQNMSSDQDFTYRMTYLSQEADIEVYFENKAGVPQNIGDSFNVTFSETKINDVQKYWSDFYTVVRSGNASISKFKIELIVASVDNPPSNSVTLTAKLYQ